MWIAKRHSGMVAVLVAALIASVGCQLPCRSICCFNGDSVCCVSGDSSCCLDSRCKLHGHCKNSVAEQVVSTGGLFASEKQLAIPSSGMTLADAVEQSLRPGVRRQDLTFVQFQQAPDQPRQSQKVEETISSDALIRKLKPEIARLDVQATAMQKAVIKTLISNVQVGTVVVGGDPSYTSAVCDIVVSEEAREAFGQPLVDGKLSDKQKALGRTLDAIGRFDSAKPKKSDLSPEVVKLVKDVRVLAERPTFEVDLQQLDLSSVSENKLTQVAIKSFLLYQKASLSDSSSSDLTDAEISVANVIHYLNSPADGSAENGADPDKKKDAEVKADKPASTDARNSPSSGSSELVAVLKRRGNKSVVVPLSLVMASPAGDVQLQDRDRVEVTSFSQTRLGRREAVSGEFIVSGFAAEEIASSPARNLQGLSALVASSQADRIANIFALDIAEGNEQYWLPVSNGAFSDMASASMKSAGLGAGDVVNVNALSLLPAIQANKVRRRIDEAEAEIKKCLHEELGTEIKQSPVSRAFSDTLRQTARRFRIPIR